MHGVCPPFDEKILTPYHYGQLLVTTEQEMDFSTCYIIAKIKEKQLIRHSNHSSTLNHEPFHVLQEQLHLAHLNEIVSRWKAISTSLLTMHDENRSFNLSDLLNICKDIKPRSESKIHYYSYSRG
jgi:hypothetical protein